MAAYLVYKTRLITKGINFMVCERVGVIREEYYSPLDIKLKYDCWDIALVYVSGSQSKFITVIFLCFFSIYFFFLSHLAIVMFTLHNKYLRRKWNIYPHTQFWLNFLARYVDISSLDHGNDLWKVNKHDNYVMNFEYLYIQEVLVKLIIWLKLYVDIHEWSVLH